MGKMFYEDDVNRGNTAMVKSSFQRCFKVVFRLVVGGILKRAFCLECGLC